MFIRRKYDVNIIPKKGWGVREKVQYLNALSQYNNVLLPNV